MLEKNILPDFFQDFHPKNLANFNGYLDFHIHTDATDGLIDTDFLINFLENIPHLIAITDHNSIESAVELYNHNQINIIPGIEVGCEDSFEFLVYFKNITDLKDFYIKYVEANKNPQKITRTNKDYKFYLNAIKNYDCFVSIPHISGIAQKNYLNNKPYIHEVLNQVDAVESYNHSVSKKKNLLAQRVREVKNLSATFGSDAHIEQEILSFQKLQSKSYSKFFYLQKNIYNFLAGFALLSKHLYHFINV